MGLWDRLRGGDDFLRRELLLATRGVDLPLGEQRLASDLDLGIVTTEATDGRSVLPVFTSESRLLKWMPGGSPWIGLSGRDVLALFLNGEWEAIVIDPSQPDGRVVSRAQAKNLLGR